MVLEDKMKNIKKIASELTNASREGRLETYLDGILTVGEIEEIAKRIEIVKLLKAKVPHHEIAARLGVGVATVTREDQRS